MLRRIFFAFLIVSAAVWAADKPSREIQELQRDVAQLQLEVQTLRKALEEKVGAATTQMQAMTETMGKLNASVAAVGKGVEQVGQDQERKLAPMIAQQGSRVDQAATSLSTMQQAIADLTSAVNRVQIQLSDLANTVKVIATPAPKPPSAEELLKSADADRLGGKFELAAQGYAEFLKTFADSPLADLAQFQLGAVHYQLKDMESAVKDFDALVTNYPKSTRLPEALFYKARSLQGLERASDAVAACAELRRRFPRSEFVKECAAPRQ